MYRRSILLLMLTLSCSLAAYAQSSDSLKTNLLDVITVETNRDKQPLPDVQGTTIFAGKKSEILILKNGDSNLPQNVGRTIFARIPGINLWDMDGAGTQMNIGTRGTDAHRSIEMNMRQNGYNTNSDIFGYPENHYTVPMQGVSQVQLVRGSASLQFGSQFGGMMNYVMKEGDTSKVFSVESEQTVGSYNLYNSFNAIGGKKGKVSYYGYYDNRHGDGWRPNSAFNYKAYYANIRYALGEKGSLALQFSRMDYRQQIAGGLTDAQFNENARQSNRARNYFSPIINIPALILNYELTPATKLQVTTNALWGERSSVQFINTANVKDTFNTAIGSYNPRQVDRDFYTGFAVEARLLHLYSLGKISSVLSGGIRYSSQETNRRQKGVGTTGSDFDLSLTGPYGIDLKFRTVNYAIFAENIFYLTSSLSVTPGLRYEVIDSGLHGVIDGASFPVSYAGDRNFPLFGIGVQYQVSPETQLYGNVSEAYRPYLYSSITPADQIGVIDPNLKDSRGYTIDGGYRGQLNEVLNFDVNAYYLFYGDKIGKVTARASDNTTYLLTTNVGNSVTRGVEAYLNVSLMRLFNPNVENYDFKLFSSLAYTHARYTTGTINAGGGDISLVDNRVEGVPDWVERAGLEFAHRHFSTTIQMSYVSDQFNDANNTPFSATGLVGYVPSYTLFDWSFNWTFLQRYHVSGGANNLADARYFSRRINMYPGPGILPADGRTFYLSLGLKL
ncbi:MAG TPA: TonB-dependent receptor [Chryseosolibacter sp.]